MCCKSQNSSSSPTAFNFQKNVHYSNSRPNKSSTECMYCHKKGHWIWECQKHLSNEKKKNAHVATQKGKGDLTSVFNGSNSDYGDAWISDMGAKFHIICDCHSFTEYPPLLDEYIKGMGGIKTQIHGSGTVTITMRSSTGSHSVELRNCFHILENNGNLLSLHCFDQASGEIQIKSDKIILITQDGIELCWGQAHGKSSYLMEMQMAEIPAVMAGTMRGGVDGQTWEEWHIMTNTPKSIHDSGTIIGMKVIPSLINFNCDVCIHGKHSVYPLPKESTTQYTEISELIITDVWAPAQVTRQGRFRYYISFTDAAT